jgi:hypothetical protein
VITSAVGRPRQLAALAVPAARVIGWQPMVAASLGAVALVALGTPAGAPLRLSIAGACLAASAAFVIDDPAAVTVATSPTSLFVRRALRAAAAAVGAGMGWSAALAMTSSRVDALAIWPATVEFAAFLVVALAVSAVAASLGDGTDGAITGAVVTMVCFASTFLPEPPWLPFPPDPAAPGAGRRLLLILAVAALVLAFASRDPAAGRPRGLRSVI